MKFKFPLALGCVAAVFASWSSDAVAAQLVDVTFPGDPNISTSNNSPGVNGPFNAIDDDRTTKDLNFDRLNTGFTIGPRLGLTLVRGLTLTSANDAPERDPTSDTLEGSCDWLNFTPIASGLVPAFPARFHQHAILFENDLPYLQYRLIFPTINGSSGARRGQQSRHFRESCGHHFPPTRRAVTRFKSVAPLRDQRPARLSVD